jgi:hypothetical protein
MRCKIGLVVGCLILTAHAGVHAQTARTGTGADAAAITGIVNQFRADLGNLNANGPCDGIGCVPGLGRREVNWDAVPDGFASPNAFPGNFFNQATGAAAGRIRGIELATSGVFEVSATAASGVAPRFGNHDPQNADDFAAFSAERIFGIVGANELDITFSVPGAPGRAATVRGFGAVFTDVENDGGTRIDYYDMDDNLLQSVVAPPFSTSGSDTFGSFSFAGLSFDTAVIRRVHIVNGGYDLDLTQFGVNDASAMDDFLFGEPLAIPEPAGAATAALAMLAMGCPRKKR